MKKFMSRTASFLTTFLIYLLALALGALLYRQVSAFPPLWAMLLADVAATLVVWLTGVILGNSSLYDPYWSVAPLPIAFCWAAERDEFGLAHGLLLAALLVWAVRLTANWARRWKGLNHQDWRYTMYRNRMPQLWPAVNLFGIHLMPTVFVYLSMIPVYYAMTSGVAANLLTWAGFLLALGAVGLEHCADRQMDTHRRKPGSCSPIHDGLWRVCRHPNYLGEILFWWGIWVMQASLSPALWTIAGPVAITVLFVCVSIPMMERHVVEKHPQYTEIIREVPMLLPSPRRLLMGSGHADTPNG